MKALLPSRKVSVAALAGLLGVVVFTLLSKYAHQSFDPTFVSASEGLLMVVLAYIVPEADQA